MQHTEYFVLTQIIVDDVYFPWGDHKLNQLGGGTYTAAGLRFWSEHVGICSGLGPDFEPDYSQWFHENGIDVAAALREAKCVHAKINYFEDGEREELLLPGYGSHALMLPRFPEIPARYADCKGMYFYKDCDASYWTEALDYFSHFSGVACWELAANAADAKYHDAVADCLSSVELFSLNLSEAKRLTGAAEPMEVLKQLRQMHARGVILRMGAKGALVTKGDGVWHIPAVPANVVDVTGGGNSSTGGFLAGYCESGGDIVHAGLCAAVSASFIIQQYGVPLRIDSVLMQKAREKLNTVQATQL